MGHPVDPACKVQGFKVNPDVKSICPGKERSLSGYKDNLLFSLDKIADLSSVISGLLYKKLRFETYPCLLTGRFVSC